MEEILSMINMFIHLFATVAFIGGSFYMLLITGKRKAMNVQFDYSLDRYVENIIEGQPVKCFIYLTILILTGFGFPAIYYAFHGHFKEVTTLALGVLIAKNILIIAALALMTYMYFGPSTRVKEIMQEIRPDKEPKEEEIKNLSFWRVKRRSLCKTIFIVQIFILILTAVLRFSV